MREFEKNIRKVEPYVPGEQPQKKVIKLNTNENPYPPAPGVLAAMKKLEGHVDSLRLYPDPTSDTLVSALADFYHVGKDQVFVGVGSDDVLSLGKTGFLSGYYIFLLQSMGGSLPDSIRMQEGR